MAQPNLVQLFSGSTDYATQQARAEALAQALQQQSFRPLESQNVPGARVSPMQGLAKLAEALAAKKQTERADALAKQAAAAQMDWYKALIGGGVPTAGAAPTADTSGASAGSQIDGNPMTQSPATQPWTTQNGFSLPSASAPQSGSAPSAPQQGGGLLPSLTGNPQQDFVLLASDPNAYFAGVVDRFKPTDLQRNANAVYGEGTPAARAAIGQSINPDHPLAANGALVSFNPLTNRNEISAVTPDYERGTMPIVENGKITGVQALPGSTELAAERAGSIRLAESLNSPHWAESVRYPGTGNFVYPQPPPGAASSQTQTPTPTPTPAPQSSAQSRPTAGAPAAGAPGAYSAADLEYDKERAKQASIDMEGIVKAASVAPINIANANRIDRLLGDYEGGKLTSTGMTLSSMANSLGFRIDSKLGDKEAAVALSNQMALDLRAGGAMPGSLSDSDRSFLVSMAPNINQTAEGRKLILQSYVALQRRNQEVARMASRWEGKYGSIIGRNPQGESFNDKLAEWSAQHPLFGGQ